MEKKYLDLDYTQGSLYEFSKEPKEGFSQHKSTKGNISYRKYYDRGVSGVLGSVSVRDTDFGRKISFSLDGGTYINFSLTDSKGNIDQFAEAIIARLHNLSKGCEITIYPYNFLPDGAKYNKKGVNILVDGEKVTPLTFSYWKDGKLVEGDIPAIKYTEDRLDKTKKKPSLADTEKKNDYLMDVLAEQTERLKWVSQTPQEATNNHSNVDDEVDSLPF